MTLVVVQLAQIVALLATLWALHDLPQADVRVRRVTVYVRVVLLLEAIEWLLLVMG